MSDREDAALEQCVLFTLEGVDDAVVASAIPGRLKTRTVYPEAGRLLCLAGGALPDGATISGELRGVTVTASPAAADALDGEGLVSIPGWGPGVRFDPQAVDAVVAAIIGEQVEAVTLRRLHRLYRAVPTFDREPCAGVPAGFADFVAALDKDTAPAAGNAFTGAHAFNAQDLAAAELPPVQWAVNGLLPVGLALLVAAPKVGKSWAALDLALDVASGAPWLGHETTQGCTLYLALEDSAQRLQARMAAMMMTDPPAECEFLLQAPDLGHGLLDRLAEWRKTHDDARLVIIDTFQRIRVPGAKSENAYERDYRTCMVLQHWAMQNGVCLLLLHHTRKTIDPADVFSSINGSSGIFGSADAVLTLAKKHRFDDSAVLSITGRDVMQDELDVTFDKTLCRWTVNGRVDDLERERAEAEFIADPLVCLITNLVNSSPAAGWAGTLDQLRGAAEAQEIEIVEDGVALGRKLARISPELRSRAGIIHTARLTNGKRMHRFKQSQTACGYRYS